MLFQVDISGKSFVYITVITEDGKVIADALSRTPNKSIIVGGDGMVCDATPDQTWVDTNGQCHITEMKKSEEKEIRNKKYVSYIYILSFLLCSMECQVCKQYPRYRK